MTKFRQLILFKTIPFAFAILIAINISAQGQIIYNTSPDYYDVPTKRMLVIGAANFIYQVSQGQLDLDSANIMACQMYKINRLLPYNERFDLNTTTPGMLLIDQEKILETKKLLKTQRGVEKLRTALELGSYYLFKPGSHKDDLDSARRYIAQADEMCNSNSLNKWKNECTLLYGKYYAQAGDMKQSQKCFEKVIGQYKEKNEEASLASALTEQAALLFYRDPKKLEILQRALVVCRDNQLKIQEIQVLTAIVTIHFALNYDQALPELIKVLELQKAIGYKHIHFVQNVLCYVYLQKFDYMTALHYAEESLKGLALTGDKAFFSLYDMRMADVFLRLNEVDEALAWYQKSLDTPLSKETQIFWYKAFVSKSVLLSVLDRYQESLSLIQKIATNFPPRTDYNKMYLAYNKGICYEGLRQMENAKKEYDLFYNIAQNFPSEFVHHELPNAYTKIAYFYFKIGRYKVSRELSKTAMSMFSRLKDPNCSGLYYLFFQLDSVEGNYPSAIRNLQHYQVLVDSIVNVKQRQKYDELQVQYQAAAKDNNIKILQQTSDLQRAKLKQSDFVRNMTLGGLGLLSIILVLLYYLYQSKQNINIQLRNQQLEISHKNVVLENLVIEKEWLVKEIHHRVKNNLHTIVSLLESQSAFLGNDALAAVKDSQHRIHAMSLIHQKLYLDENMTSINMSDYIKELIDYLIESFGIRGRIIFEVNIDPIDLDVAVAIPLGLILNEAITNSIKYAFKENGGCISIRFAEHQGAYILNISDDGIGLVLDSTNGKSNSLGMTLMKGLCKEINAEFKIANHLGTAITITMPILTLKKNSYPAMDSVHG